jgi:prophage regulatory protein
MSDKILRINEVVRVTGISKSQIYRLVACHSFPKPLVLSVGRVGWLESEVQGWIKVKAGDR